MRNQRHSKRLVTGFFVAALQMCVRVLQMYARKSSHTARDCQFRQQSRASYMLALCLRAVLISSPDTWDWTRMHAFVVMHRRTLCENVDSAKIKVPFYTTDIYILRINASYRHTFYRYIDESLHPYYLGPNKSSILNKWSVWLNTNVLQAFW